MSLTATYFNSVINYKFCFQDVTEKEFITLKDFLENRFNEKSYELLHTDGIYHSAVWLKFFTEQDELKFKLLWKDFH